MLAFLLSPLGRKLMAGVAIVVLLYGAYAYVYGKGKDAGRVDGQAIQLEQDKKQFESDRTQFLQQLEAYKVENTRLNTQLASQDAAIVAIRNQRVTTAAAVQRMSDPEVAAALSGIDQRTLLAIVRDYPQLQAQLKATDAKVETLTAKVDNEAKRADAATAAYDKLVPLYVKAYDAAQVHHSKFVCIITFGLRCTRHLDLPAPATLISK